VKHGVIMWLSFLGVILIGVTYWAWTSMSTVSSWDPLTASNWNSMVGNINHLNDNKLDTSWATASWVLNMGTNKIIGLATPTANTDAATKAYVDSVAASGGEDLIFCSTSPDRNGGHYGSAAWVDAECVADCWAWSRFATIDDILSVNKIVNFGGWAVGWLWWGINNCSNWSSTSWNGTYLWQNSSVIDIITRACSTSEAYICVTPKSNL
jgi:hypothetical protein